MQITINFHGNIYADFHGCPNLPVEDFFPDEFDEEIEGVDADDFDPDCDDTPDVPDVPAIPDAPNLIFCTVDGSPEEIPPAFTAALANAAAAFFQQAALEQEAAHE